MAGRMLLIAAANVAVVYFNPRKYKFWSMTGLPVRKSCQSFDTVFHGLENLFSSKEIYSRMLSATIFMKIESVILGLTFLLKTNSIAPLQFLLHTNTHTDIGRQIEKTDLSRITANGVITTKATACL